MIWLALLAPMLGALLMAARPDHRIAWGASGLAILGTAGGLVSWRAWSATLTWLPRNAQDLLELGVRSDPLALALLLSLHLKRQLLH